jgi:hypothetical protein
MLSLPQKTHSDDNKSRSLGNSTKSPPLSVSSHHIESRLQSANMRTLRYSTMMKPFHALVGSMGEILYEFFDYHFGFPSWREVERYRAKCWKALGLHEVNFSLSRQSLGSLTPE